MLLEYQGEYEAAGRIYQDLLSQVNNDLERAQLNIAIAYTNFALQNTPGYHFNDALAYLSQ